jgi:hypothetical protein
VYTQSEMAVVSISERIGGGFGALEFKVTATGYGGGDTGHGAYAELTFEKCADISVSDDGKHVVLRVGGDSELDLLRRACEVTIQALNAAEQANSQYHES